jgi:F-type H+-transporting ATPase subunit b
MTIEPMKGLLALRALAPRASSILRGVAALMCILAGATLASAAGGHGEGHHPSASDLLFPAINFLLFVYLIRRAGSGAVRDALSSRRAAMMAAIEAAEQAKREAERAHAEARAQFERGSRDAAQIREDMQAVARLERERRQKIVEETAARMKADARMIADQEVRAARAALRAETVHAAVAETLAVLRRQLKDADQERFVADFVSGLGAAR